MSGAASLWRQEGFDSGTCSAFLRPRVEQPEIFSHLQVEDGVQERLPARPRQSGGDQRERDGAHVGGTLHQRGGQ